MKNKTRFLLIIVLAVLTAFAFVSCADAASGGSDSVSPGGGSNDPGTIAVFFHDVTQNGNSSNTTTELYLNFSQAIPGLSASDIALSGVSGIQKGTLSSIEPGTYSLPISGFTRGGTLSVSVSKTGYYIYNSPSTVTIFHIVGAGTEADPIPLTVNTWMDGSITSTVHGSAVWYSFDAVNGTTYYLWWNDGFNGDGTKTLGISVEEHNYPYDYDEYGGYSYGRSFDTTDGWTTSQSFTADVTGTVKLQVTPHSSGNTGTFAIVYSTGITRPSRPAGEPVSGVSLNKSSTTIAADGTETLFAAILPENATNQNLIWSSSDAGIATVSESGVVSAVNAGTTIITVSTEDGGYEDSCYVTVSAVSVAVSGVSLNKNSTWITVGGTETLFAAISPFDATNQNLSWSSSNPSVVTVSPGGVISAVSYGYGDSTTITVSTVNGGYKAYCSVYVSSGRTAVNGVSLNKSSTDIIMGNTETFTATLSPGSATNQNLMWSSSDPGVATVSKSGMVYAVSTGTAIITVTTVDGDYYSECYVTVSDIPVSSVSLNKTSTTIVAGDTEQLVATIEPVNAANQNLTWSSSNINIATVSQDGIVSAVTAGNAYIYAAADNGKSASCYVTVNRRIITVSGISMNKSTTSLIVGGTELLTATIAPSDADNTNLTWSSSNLSVATVSAWGGYWGYNVTVTGVSAGTATITVTTADGGHQATCIVNVMQNVPPGRIEYYWVDAHGSLATTSGGAVTVYRGETLAISLAASAQSSDYVVQKWLLNGVDTGQSGNTYNFSSATIGNHTVTLFVEKDDQLYNTNIIISVEGKPREVRIQMYDSFGDGWNGALLRIYVNGINLSGNATVGSGYNNIYNFDVLPGDSVTIYWNKGTADTECSFIVYYTDTPPDPAFSTSNNNSWSGSNALVYGLRGNMNSVSNGASLGSFTVP